jgi:hypothetical protein
LTTTSFDSHQISTSLIIDATQTFSKPSLSTPTNLFETQLVDEAIVLVSSYLNQSEEDVMPNEVLEALIRLEEEDSIEMCNKVI